MESLLYFIYGIFQSIKKWYREQRGYTSFKLQPVSSKSGFYCRITTIGKTSAGNIGTYRIIPLSEAGEVGWTLLIKLDYLPRVQAPVLSRPPELSFISGKAYSQKYRVTHRLYIYREYSPNFILPTAIYEFDLLQRKSGGYIEERISIAFKATVLRTLLITHTTRKTHDVTWAGQISRVNWINWLEEDMRFYLKDNEFTIKPHTVLERKID